MCPSTKIVTPTEETPNTFAKTVPGRDSSEQGLNQVEPPRRILRTREASREDAIASTRQFFATVNIIPRTPFIIPRTQYTTFADRSFSVYGPRIWNALPKRIREIENLDQFKTQIKTFYFKIT